MILSVSRRTDIPAFYSEWFYNRIKEGFVLVRNPINPRMVSNIKITPDVVDCIVFWTKDPGPMLPRLNELDPYNYYFHVTINPYGRDIECAVPKRSKVMESFKNLSDRIGPERVIWRYNPVLFSNNIDMEYHVKYFEELAKRLSGSTGKCILSFLDNYMKTERNLKGTSVRALEKEEINETASQLATIAASYQIELQSCAGKIDFTTEGITPGRCIDHILVEKITGYPIETRKDRNQRKVCQCIESMDIGEYDSCPHYCLYCYANSDKKAVLKKSRLHDPDSPLLIGHMMKEDIITDRMCCSLRKKGLFR